MDMKQSSSWAMADSYDANLPDYMTEVYNWAYVDPKKVRWLDRNLVVRVLLFFNDQRLIRAYLNEIREGMKVWQVAHVYGDLVKRVADKVGSRGIFHLTDVTPVQIEHAQQKLADKPWCKVMRRDAADFFGEEGVDYDLICSFFLLHEVPENKKYQIVNRMLELLPKGGKAIFVDYGRPAKWQPIRYILKVVNRLLEPFAEALWNNEIKHYAREAEKFVWEKKTFFGGVYQCVTVRHKECRGFSK
ncbi:MAG: rhodoquinone biosynthesis methyltransferase RquA [Azoarcus sp.]|jgi:ubiquinone/menaquinone biosynthesis C-methylase UbiE|nr:rhodoquinone biosynthesis methyltransferase RquA [Azoarcus sp.]